MVLDRTISEDIEVFMALHRARGYLNANELATLTKLAMEAATEIGNPNIHVLMTASREVILHRLKAVSAPWPVVDSLDEQLALYQRWASGVRGTRLVVDTSNPNREIIHATADWILSTAHSAASGLEARNEQLGLVWLPTEVA